MIDNNDIDTRLWDHYLNYVNFHESAEKSKPTQSDEDMGENIILLTKTLVTRNLPKDK